MPLGECVKRTTHREYLLWQSYLNDPKDHLTPTQWLLARISQRVQQVLTKDRSKISLDDQKVALEFVAAVPESDIDTRSKNSLMRWLPSLGKAVKRVRRN